MTSSQIDAEPTVSRRTALAQFCLTIAIGGAGAAGFNWLGLPAAWLSGAMIVVAAATFAGLRAKFPTGIQPPLYTLLGMTMGSGVTPDVVHRIGDWPVSLAGLAVVVALVMLATYVFLRQLCGWTKEEAYFAAIPGALTFVMAVASDRRTDVTRFSTAHIIRLFFLVAALPLFIGQAGGAGMGGSAEAAPVPLEDTALGLVICVAASFAAVRLRIPGGWLTGAFFASALASGTGFLDTHVPDWALIPCFVILGASIGIRFCEISPAMLLRLLAASVGAFAVGLTVSVVGALAVALTLGIPAGQVLLAYAPGGLEVMMLLAYLLDMDPAFVAAHQLARYIALILILPPVTLAVLGRSPRGGA
ncbi:ammonia monooxygenase [Pannonibacter phragmitetus]|uniref:AbrB family transcriptional regulator n=1 Tax=Pannonibacter phragmitetus TaxID=121719 RepID=UPI00067CB35E|nr:AbrB family transcriptional regulator [Pannonibacter phragmitetus]KND21008.1 ammonia monooxygenase [Pannonibacter phragmitetus]